MTSYHVEFVMRDDAGRLVLRECFRTYPEPRAREWARMLARHEQTGARVKGPEGEDLAWYLWIPSRSSVVQVAPGTDWRRV